MTKKADDTLRFTIWNVNGLRAAIRKGFADYVERINPDVLMLQEVRAFKEQLPKEWQTPKAFPHVVWHPAEKPGYSGTAVLSKLPFEGRPVFGIAGEADPACDPEGRLITVKVAGVRASCLYLPSGSSGEARQGVKDQWLHEMRPLLEKLSRSRTAGLVGGDINTAHDERDIFHAKSNEKSSGYLPHERAWFSEVMGMGLTDVVRTDAGDVKGPYTWWSNRGKARELDRGWRIDHFFANTSAMKRFASVSIDREAGVTCSDHAPVSLDLALS